MNFIDKNQKKRDEFIRRWAKFVREHADKEWSKQQNIIINSSIKSAEMTREEFFEMKGEANYVK